VRTNVAELEPGAYVATRGDAPAVIYVAAKQGTAPDEISVSFRELDERSKRFGQLLSASGLRPGDHMAILMDNNPRYFEVFWGAQRAGLYVTPINWHLKSSEAGYIIEDCGATALVISAALAVTAEALEPYLAAVSTRLVVDGDTPGYERYEDAIARFPGEALADEVEGTFMFYSSGTTGRPKGIMPPLDGAPFGSGGGTLLALIQQMYGLSSDSVYLCPAPLYHAAPLGWSTAAQRVGATVVVMESFDAEQALATIEEHRVTHAQFVPTHFIRMLKLPEAARAKYDLSSLEVVVHAAAPCPVEVKRQMLDWWGPIVHEYYAGSEGNGFCAAGPEQWLAHPGTVGVPLLGTLHILDDDGTELQTGEVGQIWFESNVRFEYHNDPAKTADAFNDRGWSSLGDVGYLDADGFLYLTDRVSHMIISGGVNIYPQEVENELALHPNVADVAVIGVPDAEMGEEVKAVVVAAGVAPGPELEAALLSYCRERLAHYKCPRSVDFVHELPRLPTGKLLKRQLRDRYWQQGGIDA